MFTLNNNDNTKDLLENDLECPISRDIMKDPVTTCDGYTYDNSDITQWLKSNNRSPQTNLPLANKGLVPNLFAKKAIQQYRDYGHAHVFIVAEDYRCPITKQVMVDPVLAKDGHTYEREAMIQWLEKSDKSPVTQEILKSKYLATNYFARNRIAGYHSAQAFFEAVRQGQEKEAMACLQKGVSINTRFINGLTALHVAVDSKNNELCQFLLANNLDVDAIDSMGQTAFHYAVMKDNLDLLGIILQSRPAIVQDSKQQTPLDLICQIIVSMGINKVRVAIMQSVLLYFYQNIIDINFNSVDLINLHHAAAIGNLMAAKLLQEMGHGTEAIDAKNRTPLQVAMTSPWINYQLIDFLLEKSEKREILELLTYSLQKKDGNLFDLFLKYEPYTKPTLGIDLLLVGQNIPDNLQNSWWAHVAKFSNLRMLRNLLLIGYEKLNPDQKQNLWHSLVFYHRFDFFRSLPSSLIKHNLDLLLKLMLYDGYHSLLLFLLQKQCIHVNEVINEEQQTLLHHYVMRRHPAIVQFLLHQGANINQTDINKRSPLHWTILDKNLAMTQLLIAAQADVNAIDANGDNALSLALEIQHIPILEVVLSKKPKIGQLFHRAVQMEAIAAVALLLQHNAEVNLQDNKGKTGIFYAVKARSEILVRELLKQNVDVNRCDKTNLSALCETFDGKRIDAKGLLILDLLIQKNANLNLQYGHGSDWNQDTILHRLIDCLPNSPEEYQGIVAMVEKCVHHGASCNLPNGNGETVFHRAIIAGADFVEIFVSGDINLFYVDSKGNTYLHYAVQCHCLKVVEFLLDRNIEVLKLNHAKETAIDWAIKYDFLGLFELLMAKNINCPLWTIPGHTNWLHQCAEHGAVNVMHFLLQKKLIDVNIIDIYGCTPLHIALQTDCTETLLAMLDILIFYGADVNARDIFGNSPLHIFALFRDSEAELSSAPGPAFLYSQRCEAVIDRLIKNGAAVNAVNGAGNTCLHYSAASLATVTLQKLLAKGADLSVIDNQRNNVFHYFSMFDQIVALYKSETTSKGQLKQQPEISAQKIQKLLVLGDKVGGFQKNYAATLYAALQTIFLGLSKKISVNSRNNNGDTPLHITASRGTELIGKLLLGTGANKEIVNNSSNTPTSIAVINNQLSMVILLLDHKFEQSDVEIEQGPSNVNDSPVKNIPLHQAIWRDDKDMVSLLVVKHENINTVNEQGHASLHISVLSKNKWMISFFLNVGAAVDIQDSKGRTPLHLVVEMDDVELVKIFSEHNKKALNVKDIDGHTPLHKAAIYGHFAVFKALLKAGADLDCPDDAGAFTIHLAISHGQTRIADFLIEKYPNLMMARDHRGLTPLCITIMHSQKAIFNRLIAQGAQLEVMDIQGRLWTIDKQWENNAVLRTGLNTATYGNLPLQFTRDWFFNSTPELQQARQKFLLDFVGTNRAESLDKKLMVFLQQLFVKFRRDPDEIIKPTKAVFSNDTIDGSYPVYKENRRSVPVAIVRRLVLDLLLDPVYDPYQHRQLIYAFFVVYDQYQKGNRSQHYAGELALYHLYRDCLEAPDLYFSSDFDKMRRHCEAELKAAFNATLSPTLLLMHNDSFYQKNHLSLSILTRIGDELMRLHNNNAALSEYLYQIYIARLERQVTIRADFVNNAAVWSRIRKEGLSNKEEKIKEQVLGIMQQCMIAICESNASRLEKTKALITIFKVTGKSLDKWFYDQAHFHRLIDFSSSRYSSFYSFNLYQALVWAKESDFSKIHHRYQDSIEWAFMVASINLGFHFGHDIFYKKIKENLLNIPRVVYRIGKDNIFFNKPSSDQLLSEIISAHLKGDMRLTALACSFILFTLPPNVYDMSQLCDARKPHVKKIQLSKLFGKPLLGPHSSKEVKQQGVSYNKFVKLQLSALLLLTPEVLCLTDQELFSQIIIRAMIELIEAYIYENKIKMFSLIGELKEWLFSSHAQAPTLLLEQVGFSTIFQKWNAVMIELAKTEEELEKFGVISIKEKKSHHGEIQRPLL